MYEEFFSLAQRPFLAAARVDRYYPAETIEQARKTIVRTVDRGDGFAIAVAPSGVGKTLLCNVIAEQFSDQFRVAHLSTGRMCSPRALLQAILYELRLPYRDMSEGELRLSLVDHLEPSPECANGMLLIVDEAHSLPLRLFEEIRMITNLARDGMPRVRLVLAGNNRLEERLNEPRLESFSQRIIARCYLEPFSRDDTLQYIRAQFAAAGGNPDRVLAEDALVAVHRATDGIARLINQLCDHALILARTAGAQHIDAARIEEAWADLQQLPPPTNTSTVANDAAETTIEFGTLDDEPAEAGTTVNRDEKHASCVARFDDAQHTACETARGTSVHADSEIERATEHLDRIEAQFAQLNSDSVETLVEQSPAQTFQPLGSFQQEVEFDIAQTPDPFSESYDDEEVVIDRYAALAGSIAGRPQVYSSEGRAIADALAPYDTARHSPRLAEVDQPDDDPCEASAVDHEPSDCHSTDDCDSGTDCAFAKQSSGAAVCEMQTPEEQQQSTPHTDQETPLVVTEEESTEPLVYADDDSQQPPQHEPEPQVTVVEPNQFSTLFTSLRRSTGT